MIYFLQQDRLLFQPGW